MLSEKEIQDLFSVIPETESRRAQTELRARLSSRTNGEQTRIAWVDLDRSMKPIGAGITDFEGLSSSRINTALPKSKHPPELAELMSVLDSGDARVGQIQASGLTDRFLWFVPVSPRPTSEVQASHRAMSVSFHVLAQLIDTFNPDAGLTNAEARVSSQIVAGLSLSESARVDGLQTETRRGQFKRACAKLSVSGQGALIRLILSQAIHLVFIIDEQMRASTGISELAETHLPDTVRVELHHLSDGRLLRLFEVGDPGGRPIIVVHGLFFVPLLQSLARHGALTGLRFIVPLRDGYLSPPEDSMGEDPNSQSGLADLMTHFKGQAPILMGHSLGCIVAVRLALAHPKLVPNLVLLSPFFGQPRDGRAVYLSRIMKVVARFRADGLVFRLVAAQFAKSYAKPHNVRTALNRVFGSCRKDAEVLHGDAGVPPVDTWFGQTFRDSVTGVAEDFKTASQFALSEVSGLTMPCTILTGDEDPIVNHDTLTTAAGTAKITTLPNAGHFAIVTDRQVIIDALSTAT
ncbi:MAG: alpha/beta fold hydrolase [Pseudomonadota bacterium]